MVIAVLVLNTGKVKTTKRYRFNYQRGDGRYVPGEFSDQMELDLRLPYRRFKQLYPHSRISYQEYKQLQMRKAFRRSMSSQQNQRMVR